jgi:murein L,D-transpeptidase YcbB/YkuD
VRVKTVTLFLCTLLLIASCTKGKPRIPSEAERLKAQLEQQQPGEIVRAIYEGRQFRLIWFARGQKLPLTQQFLQLVDDPSHGLDPQAYRPDASLVDGTIDPLQRDVDLTKDLVRYAEALARKDADVQKEVVAAIQSGSLNNLPARLEPLHPEYAALRQVLPQTTGTEREKVILNMERWRQVPDDLGDRYISVNIPAYSLEVHEGNEVRLRMKAIVGASDKQTPVLNSAMNVVVFSPYWNIPESILTKETLPHIRKDPEYFDKENLEVIRLSGKRAQVVDPDAIDWDHVSPSRIQLRQKPGVSNSLGLVKFLFPNPYDVYIHATNANRLFGKASRDLSHGCVRIERPQDLAEYVLRDQPEWTPEKISRAMHAGTERQVRLKTPIPVHIMYFTAWVDDSGNLQVAKDVYGYDTTD